MFSAILASLPSNGAHALSVRSVAAPLVDASKCTRCGGLLRIAIDTMQHICIACKSTMPYVDASLAPGLSIDVSTTQTHRNSSLKLVHFQDLVASIQSRRQCRVPVTVARAVAQHIVAHAHVTNVAEVTLFHTHEALLALATQSPEISKYKTASLAVFCAITGREHRVIGSEATKRLRYAFSQFERAYAKRNVKCYRTVLKTLCRTLDLHIDGMELVVTNEAFAAEVDNAMQSAHHR